ncbi:MAG: beta-lactamase family protein [Bacteroidales bacterium]|nr:beta-lactamase family protein [Bacteroidales bacterium]MCF8344283.1 beta-lactamase family protein [Bacteroidales bacterium]MCF8351905.1 beta-lactamase family protein [Bacteroidales bacterium]MCF8377323.1 beta-lactamase family protein [Bacteroidales bacterium]
MMNFYRKALVGSAVSDRMTAKGSLADDNTIDYGYGLYITEIKDKKAFVHDGAWGGYRSATAFFPEESTGVVILSNDGAMQNYKLVARYADYPDFHGDYSAAVIFQFSDLEYNEIKQNLLSSANTYGGNMKTLLYSISVLCLACSLSNSVKAQARLDLETGLVFTGYNNVGIPGDGGTRFSLKDDLVPEPTFFYRLSAAYTIKSRHTVLLLYAPLQTKSEGRIPHEVLFEGEVFPENTPLEGTYKFNSYRLTYRYDIVKNPSLEFGLGITAKIRDAKIALSSPGLASEKTNVGFVPLINFRLFWSVGERFGLLLEGDALAAPQGRAEDVLLAASYGLSDHFRIRAGYRILEGGADNEEVYNFSLFNYASAGITYTFLKADNP